VGRERGGGERENSFRDGKTKETARDIKEKKRGKRKKGEYR